MPIEAIVVPSFQIVWTLQERLEDVYKSAAGSKVINEEAWPITEIHLRTCEYRHTYDFSVPDRNLIFYIDVDGLSVACDYLILASSQENIKALLSLLLVGYKRGSLELIRLFEPAQSGVGVFRLIELVEAVGR